MKRLMLLMLLCGCGSSIKYLDHPKPEKLEVVGVFVYPVGFRWGEPAYRSFELAQRMVNVGVETGGSQLSFWGPGEFRVMRIEDDAAWVASTALPLLTGSGARPDQGLIFRPWAEKRVSSSMQEASDARGRRAGASNAEETVFIGHLEVIHPSSHEVLLEAEAQVKVDPFTDQGPEGDFDPSPPLTRLMEQLMRGCVQKLQVHAPARTTQELPPVSFAFSPAASLGFQEGNRPSAQLDMAKLDAASLDIFVQARAKYLNPTLSDLEASKVAKALPGLLLLAPLGSLSEGDLVTTLDGQPASPQAWARLRFSPQVVAKARKPSGEMVEVPLP